MLFGSVVKTYMKKSQPIATEGSPVRIAIKYLLHENPGGGTSFQLLGQIYYDI